MEECVVGLDGDLVEAVVEVGVGDGLAEGVVLVGDELGDPGPVELGLLDLLEDEVEEGDDEGVLVVESDESLHEVEGVGVVFLLEGTPQGQLVELGQGLLVVLEVLLGDEPIQEPHLQGQLQQLARVLERPQHHQRVLEELRQRHQLRDPVHVLQLLLRYQDRRLLLPLLQELRLVLLPLHEQQFPLVLELQVEVLPLHPVLERPLLRLLQNLLSQHLLDLLQRNLVVHQRHVVVHRLAHLPLLQKHLEPIIRVRHFVLRLSLFQYRNLPVDILRKTLFLFLLLPLHRTRPLLLHFPVA